MLEPLFRAETWEELRKLAEESPFAKEVAEYMYISNADKDERDQMEAHRRFEETQATLEAERNRIKKERDEAEKERDELKEQLSQKDAIIAQLMAQLAAKK